MQKHLDLKLMGYLILSTRAQKTQEKQKTERNSKNLNWPRHWLSMQFRMRLPLRVRIRLPMMVRAASVVFVVGYHFAGYSCFRGRNEPDVDSETVLKTDTPSGP